MKNIIARAFVISPLWVAHFFHQTHHGPIERGDIEIYAAADLGGVVRLAVLDGLGTSASIYSLGHHQEHGLDLLRRVVVSPLVRRQYFRLVFAFPCDGLGAFVLAVCGPWLRPSLRLSLCRSQLSHAVRKAGWHPTWDGGFFNYDSDLIKDGGFQEPRYTDLVSPGHWKFQCPVCGTRQQTEFCVCWRCDYGADGDSSAYYRRWGR